MPIKSILAPLTGFEQSEAALVVALKLARKLGAFTDVLHVSPDPRDTIPLISEGAAGPAIVRIMEMAEADAKKRAAAAEALFRKACAAAGIVATGASAGVRYGTIVGRAPGEIALRARVHDLVLLGRVPEDAEIEWRLSFEAALMEGGRPILLLSKEPRETLGKSIAIAWNGSVEAAHAASSALPFLAQAEHVLLLAGEKDEVPVEPSLDLVAEWLRHHGITAAVKHVALKGWPVGAELAIEAAAAGADLIVMGGYGHSRMRETIFGGATRAVVNDSALPVLMAH